MKPLQQILLFITFTLLTAFLVSGCTDTALCRWQQSRDTLKRELTATTQQISTLQKEIDALPPGPMREQIKATLAKAEALAPQLAGKVDRLDQMIVAARTGDATQVGSSLGGLLAGVPVVGPYAGIIGVVAGLVWGAYQRVQRAKEVDDALGTADELRGHLKNIVTSIEAAGPEWSEQDKAAIRAVQGEATTKVVEGIKSDQ
ncbi:MAG: hypothetical protein ABSH20_22995 [Tepidisphaeraceae bacterium]|jgi:hypothetical protein